MASRGYSKKARERAAIARRIKTHMGKSAYDLFKRTGKYSEAALTAAEAKVKGKRRGKRKTATRAERASKPKRDVTKPGSKPAKNIEERLIQTDAEGVSYPADFQQLSRESMSGPKKNTDANVVTDMRNGNEFNLDNIGTLGKAALLSYHESGGGPIVDKNGKGVPSRLANDVATAPDLDKLAAEQGPALTGILDYFGIQFEKPKRKKRESGRTLHNEAKKAEARAANAPKGSREEKDALVEASALHKRAERKAKKEAEDTLPGARPPTTAGTKAAPGGPGNATGPNGKNTQWSRFRLEDLKPGETMTRSDGVTAERQTNGNFKVRDASGKEIGEYNAKETIEVVPLMSAGKARERKGRGKLTGQAKLDKMKADFSEWAKGYSWATMDTQARAWKERRKKEGAIKREETRQLKAQKGKGRKRGKGPGPTREEIAKSRQEEGEADQVLRGIEVEGREASRAAKGPPGGQVTEGGKVVGVYPPRGYKGETTKEGYLPYPRGAQGSEETNWAFQSLAKDGVELDKIPDEDEWWLHPQDFLDPDKIKAYADSEPADFDELTERLEMDNLSELNVHLSQIKERGGKGLAGPQKTTYGHPKDPAMMLQAIKRMKRGDSLETADGYKVEVGDYEGATPDLAVAVITPEGTRIGMSPDMAADMITGTEKPGPPPTTTEQLEVTERKLLGEGIVQDRRSGASWTLKDTPTGELAQLIEEDQTGAANFGGPGAFEAIKAEVESRPDFPDALSPDVKEFWDSWFGPAMPISPGTARSGYPTGGRTAEEQGLPTGAPGTVRERFGPPGPDLSKGEVEIGETGAILNLKQLSTSDVLNLLEENESGGITFMPNEQGAGYEKAGGWGDITDAIENEAKSRPDLAQALDAEPERRGFFEDFYGGIVDAAKGGVAPGEPDLSKGTIQVGETGQVIDLKQASTDELLRLLENEEEGAVTFETGGKKGEWGDITTAIEDEVKTRPDLSKALDEEGEGERREFFKSFHGGIVNAPVKNALPPEHQDTLTEIQKAEIKDKGGKADPRLWSDEPNEVEAGVLDWAARTWKDPSKQGPEVTDLIETGRYTDLQEALMNVEHRPGAQIPEGRIIDVGGEDISDLGTPYLSEVMMKDEQGFSSDVGFGDDVSWDRAKAAVEADPNFPNNLSPEVKDWWKGFFGTLERDGGQPALESTDNEMLEDVKESMHEITAGEIDWSGDPKDLAKALFSWAEGEEENANGAIDSPSLADAVNKAYHLSAKLEGKDVGPEPTDYANAELAREGWTDSAGDTLAKKVFKLKPASKANQFMDLLNSISNKNATRFDARFFLKEKDPAAMREQIADLQAELAKGNSTDQSDAEILQKLLQLIGVL